MKVRVYPQFFLRENKQAQGAHADRIQQGMSQCPFGKVVGRASRVRPNQKIFSILVDETNIDFVRNVLKKAASRFPCSMKVIVEENKDSLKSVGTTKKRKKLLAQEKETKVETTETDQKDAKNTKKGVKDTKDAKKDTKDTKKSAKDTKDTKKDIKKK
jgi:hypothetical protein